VLTAQHFLDFCRFDFFLERIDRSLQVETDVLALLGPLEQHTKIVEFADERIAQIDLFAQTAATLQGLLRFRLVLPEIRSGDARFYRCKLACGVRGVKDSSAGLWRA
jgi:hypothetical protein